MLDVQNLAKSFGGVKALSDFNFKIGKGEIQSIIGPNGAGKTTFFNLLTGVVKPTSGKIFFNNKSILKLQPHEITSHGIARTFQNLRLFPEMAVIENVMVGGSLRLKSGVFGAIFKPPRTIFEEKELIEKSLKILEFVGLKGKENYWAKNLPYGNQKRLEIGRALATEPDLLLLDEPAAGMNPIETASLIKLINQIRDKGISILIIEHDMKLVMNISEKITVLDYGEKIAEGIPSEIQQNEKVVRAYLGGVLKNA